MVNLSNKPKESSSRLKCTPDCSGQYSVVAADTRFGQRDLDPQESSKETDPL
jgi:hypothetical protein